METPCYIAAARATTYTVYNNRSHLGTPSSYSLGAATDDSCFLAMESAVVSSVVGMRWKAGYTNCKTPIANSLAHYKDAMGSETTSSSFAYYETN